MKRHVLIAEDNLDHAELILHCLRRHGQANVTQVRDGEQTLQYLRRQGEYSDPKTSPRPSLILLDLRMPRVDGLEVLREIKTSEVLKRIPVVVLSTSRSERDITRAYDLHANSYLVKPDAFDKLNGLMEAVEAYWFSANTICEADD